MEHLLGIDIGTTGTRSALFRAAVLAGAGCGVFRSIEEGSRRIVFKKREVIPDRERAEVYDGLYRGFLRSLDAV